MSADPAIPAGPRIDGLPAFQRACRQFMKEAAQHAWPRIWLIDADFADWPLGEREVVESFSAWVGAGRHMVMVFASDAALIRCHPRWLRWRASWAHCIECRLAHEYDAAALPSIALAEGAACFVLHDPMRWRGEWVSAAPAVQRARETIDGIYARSAPALAVTTLGL